MPIPMMYQIGVLASPSIDGVLLVYWKWLVLLKAKKGYYTYETLTVEPSIPRNFATTMLIPESMTTC